MELLIINLSNLQCVRPHKLIILGLISLETIGSAIPILGAIAGIAVGIRDLIRGHHEERNTNQTFEMPKGNIDVPSYNPGVS